MNIPQFLEVKDLFRIYNFLCILKIKFLFCKIPNDGFLIDIRCLVLFQEELHPGFSTEISLPVMMSGSVIVSAKSCPTGSTIPQENMDVSNPSRTPTPGSSQQQQHEYDVTRMREEDFERLAVYIVPDVPCERGVANRAEKTLPRSLTLKPSLVLSTPNVPVNLF